MAALSPFDKREKGRMDRAILTRLLEIPELIGAKSVFSYVSMAEEPDTRALLSTLFERGIPVSVPRCRRNGEMDAVPVQSMGELAPVLPYGILEPPADFPALSPKKIDCLIVPGVAFSVGGMRLGHGAGYYDRFFGRTAAIRIALCYERMLFPEIPAEPHDLPIHILVTESRMIRL